MPAVPDPDGLADIVDLARAAGDAAPERVKRLVKYRRPVQLKPVDPRQFMGGASRAPTKQVWMRATDRLPDDESIHAAVFAYISDYDLIDTATLPHGMSADRSPVQMASLDHAMWFHRPFRVDDWLLFDLATPNSSGGRGLALGHVYARDGTLLATLAQEGLIRLRQPPA
jgi:acyl-CoA thioesterase-2